MSECPAEDDLVRMVEGALGEESLVAIERHVDECEACADVVAGLGALAPRDAEAARCVGRYQLDRKIAAGGMGEVWAGWDPELRREVAIKLVAPDRADDGRERTRLLREARALARLGHPNVLAVYDVGEHEGDVFLATELVAGDTLATRSGPGADWRALVGLYVQAARGLAAAHAAGLVHRDVKPANLLLGGDGRVRVADFGLAVTPRTPSTVTGGAVPAGEPEVTARGAVAGTPAYMAPEQRSGGTFDARADQFALCVAIVESIVGRRPRAGMTADELIDFVAERRPREPDLDALCAVLARGLAVDPTARHDGVGALADQLAGIVERRPAGAPGRRGRMIIAGALALGAATNVAIVYAVRSGGNSSSTTVATESTGATSVDPPRAPGSSSGMTATTGSPAGPAGSTSGGTAPTPESTATPAGSTGTAGTTGSTGSTGTAGTTGSTAGPAGSTGTAGTTGSTAGPAGSTGTAGTTGSSTAGPAGSTGTAGTGSTAGPAGSTSGVTPSGSRPGSTSGTTGATTTGPLAGSTSGTTASSGSTGTLGPTSATPSGSSDAAGGTAAAPRTQPGVTPSSGSAPSTQEDSLVIAERAIRRRDGQACRVVLARLPVRLDDPRADDKAAELRARCAMVAGDCEGGTRMLIDRFKLPKLGAEAIADMTCAPGNDPVVRLRRLDRQTSRVRPDMIDCAYYVEPARAAGRIAADDMTRLQVGTVMNVLARCFAIKGDCNAARAMGAEAARLSPQLAGSAELGRCKSP